MAKRVYGSSGTYETNIVEYKTQSKQPISKRSKMQIILICIIAVLLVIAAIFGVLAYNSNKNEYAVVQLWDIVRKIASDKDDTFVPDHGDGTISESQAYESDPMNRIIDFDALKKINSDVLCWIYIPKTNIDYPILQEPTFGAQYYLHKDIYKKYQVAGSILTPAEADGFDGEDAHMIIFGHRMINKTMFGSLVDYKSKDFYTSSPYVYLYYPDRTERYSIFAAEHLKSNNEVYDMPYLYNTSEYNTLLSDLVKNSLYKTSITKVDSSKKTITLSTCDNVEGSGVGRFTVSAVFDSPDESSDIDLSDSSQTDSSNTNVIIKQSDLSK